MGLDGTIQRPDGSPLGDVEMVKRAIAEAFPGVRFECVPSGAEKIENAAKKGIVFPDVIRRHLEKSPAMLDGEFENEDFSAQFHLGAWGSETVPHVDFVLYGKTTASESQFNKLAELTGWTTTFP